MERPRRRWTSAIIPVAVLVYFVISAILDAAAAAAARRDRVAAQRSNRTSPDSIARTSPAEVSSSSVPSRRIWVAVARSPFSVIVRPAEEVARAELAVDRVEPALAPAVVELLQPQEDQAEHGGAVVAHPGEAAQRPGLRGRVER